MKTVPEEASVTLTVAAEVRHLCPFVREVDNGAVTVAWETRGATFELHALCAYLNTFRDLEISHEAFTNRIRRELAEAEGVNVLSVESSWTTAGMEVQCSTSQTHAAPQ